MSNSPPTTISLTRAKQIFSTKRTCYDAISQVYKLPSFNSRAISAKYLKECLKANCPFFRMEYKDFHPPHIRYRSIVRPEVLKAIERLLIKKNLPPTGFDEMTPPDIEWMIGVYFFLDEKDEIGLFPRPIELQKKIRDLIGPKRIETIKDDDKTIINDKTASEQEEQEKIDKEEIHEGQMVKLTNQGLIDPKEIITIEDDDESKNPEKTISEEEEEKVHQEEMHERKLKRQTPKQKKQQDLSQYKRFLCRKVNEPRNPSKSLLEKLGKALQKEMEKRRLKRETRKQRHQAKSIETIEYERPVTLHEIICEELIRAEREMCERRLNAQARQLEDLTGRIKCYEQLIQELVLQFQFQEHREIQELLEVQELQKIQVFQKFQELQEFQKFQELQKLQTLQELQEIQDDGDVGEYEVEEELQETYFFNQSTIRMPSDKIYQEDDMEIEIL